MGSYERYITWYSPWPLINGPSLDRQTRTIRWDTAEAAGIMRSALIDIDDSVPYHQADKVLRGLNFGGILDVYDIKNKFRIYYGREASQTLPGLYPPFGSNYLKIQLNTGTEGVPNWIDVLKIDETIGHVIIGEGGIRSMGGWYEAGGWKY